MHLGSEEIVVAVSVGVVELFFSNKILILYDCLFVSSIEKNLISVSALFKKGYSLLFNKNISIQLSVSFICSSRLVGSFYLITPKMYEIHDTELNKSQNLPLKRKASSNNPTYLWHLRLGHINLKMIDRLVKEGPLSFLTIQPLLGYTSCLEENDQKALFSKW